MSALKDMLQKLNNVFNRVTDWLLIVIGGVLVAKSAVAIDVPVAKYVVVGLGALLVGLGLWYRHRRKQRHRQIK